MSYRRRLANHYIAPKPNYLVATYNVTSTSSATRLLGNGFTLSQVSAMEIDGASVTPAATYTFSTTGTHEVKMVFGELTSCGYMFASCSGLTSLDLSNFDTSSVTNMGNMFASCKNLTSLDVSNFNTDNVTNMRYIFYYCSGLTSLDLSTWNTGKVTNMSGMFYYMTAQGLTINVSNFDTSKVTNMSYMFYACTRVSSLDLTSFDTSKVTTMERMFYQCNSLTSLTMSGVTNTSATLTDLFPSSTFYTGTFYYNDDYDYSKIIANLPSNWTAVAV